MPSARSVLSESSQRAILWWGIGLAVVAGFAFGVMLKMAPPPSAGWISTEIAELYQNNSIQTRWGAVIAVWSGAFMMPILGVVAIQMAQVETGSAEIRSCRIHYRPVAGGHLAPARTWRAHAGNQ